MNSTHLPPVDHYARTYDLSVSDWPGHDFAGQPLTDASAEIIWLA